MESFDTKYVYSAAGSIIFGVVVTLLIFPSFQGTSSALSCIESFAVAFGFGFGWYTLVNETGKWNGTFS
ncbi:hypothetical protein KGY71_06935 [Candidatus Bipolaricaulota bacterium]|nr:hypothetical protein [Candidatus Bipolaricaulota bacterium]